MSDILDNFSIDRLLLLAFVKYILSQIAIAYGFVLFDTFWRSWKLLFFEENILKVFLYLCCLFYPESINFYISEIVGNVLSTGL